MTNKNDFVLPNPRTGPRILLRSSETLFKERRWDETTFLHIPNNQHTKSPLTPMDEHDDREENQPAAAAAAAASSPAASPAASPDDLVLNHFAYRKRNIESKLFELDETFQRLVPRTTVEHFVSGRENKEDGGEVALLASDNLAADSR